MVGRLTELREAAPGMDAGPLHRHLRSEERFKMEQGRIRIRRGFRESIVIGPGEEATIPAGTPHTFGVDGDEAAVFIAEFRRPWRIDEVFQELFAMPVDKRGNPRPTDLAELMHAYPDDFFYPPIVPPAIQRTLTRPLVWLARR